MQVLTSHSEGSNIPQNINSVDKIKNDEHIFLVDEKKATLGSGSGVANFHPVQG
jgi:hypothetical protein